MKHHKKATDRVVLPVSASDSSDASAATQDDSSEDDERVSDDDLAKKARQMSEEDFTALYKSEVGHPFGAHNPGYHSFVPLQQVNIRRPNSTAADLFDTDIGVVPARSSFKPTGKDRDINPAQSSSKSVSRTSEAKDISAAPPRKHSNKVRRLFII